MGEPAGSPRTGATAVAEIAATPARSRTGTGLAGAAAVLLLGFGALLAFWLLGSWQTPRGLFHYRAAAFGDSLLLPAVAGLLLTAVRDPALPAAPHERRWAAGAAALAGALAALVQVQWLTNDHPQTNWTLPRAHHFDAPGWWHAAFFVGVSAAIAGLAVAAARRVRADRARGGMRARELAASPWLAVLLAAGVLFAGLVAVDDGRAGPTGAGASATLALALATGAGLAALLLAFGRALKTDSANLAIGLAGAAGACLLAATGLPAARGIAAIAVVTALSIGVTLTQGGTAPQRAVWLRAPAATLVLLGTAGLAFELCRQHGLPAAGVLLAGGLLAVWAGGAYLERPLRAVLVALAVAYIFGILTIAHWVTAVAADGTRSSAAVGATLTLLDVAVIALVRDRFRAFVDDERRVRSWRPEPSDLPPPPPDVSGTWSMLVAFAIPALLALGALFAVAGPAMGVDGVAGASPFDLRALLAAGMLCAGIATAALSRGWSRPPPRLLTGEVEVRVRSQVTIPIALACVAWTVVLLSALRAPLHHPAAAAVAALAMATLCAADLIDSPVRLQLARPKASVWVLAGAAALACGMAVFWLLSAGLWDGAAPVAARGAVEACAIALLISAALAIAAGLSVARALPTKHITAQSPTLNMTIQPLLYAGVAFIAAAIPVAVVGRVDATAGVQDAGLTTVASLGFLPALIGVFAWVLGINVQHARREAGDPPPAPIREGAAGDEHLVATRNETRMTRLKWRVRYVNALTGGLLAAGLVWGAAHVL